VIPHRHRLVVISALGSIQILTGGASFYLLCVLANLISEYTGWPLRWVIGGLSLGFLVAGLLSPRVGLSSGSAYPFRADTRCGIVRS
jgi:hypothetical protein